MNIIEAEDMVKGLPDQVLFQEAQFPSGRIPQYLAVSEVQRRQDMRQRFQAQQQQSQQTIKEQILQGGIGSTGMAPEITQKPPMAPPMEPPMGAAPPGAPMQQPMTGAPMGMSVGGLVIPEISSPFESEQSSSGYDAVRNSLTSQSRESIVNKAKSLMAQGKESEALSLLRRAGISPEQVLMSNGGLTPGGIVYMQQGGNLTRDPASQMLSNTLGRMPEIFGAVNKMLPPPSGISMEDLERLRAKREDYFDPQAEARRNQLLADLQASGEARKAEDIAAAQRYLTETEAPIKAAQDEARKAAISSTLMRLGAGLAAGRPEEGLASAAQGVEQTMGRARELASVERRAARQEYRAAEREAVRAQRAAADQAFAMQAQNITNDEAKQREFMRDQNSFAQWAFTQQREAGRDRNQAFNTALQLSVGISQSIDKALQDATREQSLNERQYSSTYGSVLKEVLETVKNSDFKDADGNSIVPTTEQIMDVARKQTQLALENAGIYSPNKVVTVSTPDELKSLKSGAVYIGPDGVKRVKP